MAVCLTEKVVHDMPRNMKIETLLSLRVPFLIKEWREYRESRREEEVN